MLMLSVHTVSEDFQSAGPWDPTLLQKSPWPLGQIKQSAVICE